MNLGEAIREEIIRLQKESNTHINMPDMIDKNVALIQIKIALSLARILSDMVNKE